MELIDRDAVKQELEKAINRNLRMTGRSNPGVLTALKYAIAELDSAPVVDAVPIEWIKEYIRTHPASTDIYFKWMIDEWKEEQEKQDDSH